jgi:phosphotransferase system enzyme I (PtsI)
VLSSAVFRELSREESPFSGEAQELERLERALEKTREQLELLREKARKNLGEEKAAILEAHALMLLDPTYVQKIREHIASGRSAENGVYAATREVAAVFEALPDPYLRERGADVLDVGRRLHRNLRGEEDAASLEDSRPRILVARDLPPSDAVALDASVIRGILTEEGGVTSHTALVAQSLEIPGISGVRDLESRIPQESYLCIHAETGEVLVDPSPEELAIFRQKARAWQEEEARLERLRPLEAVTKDGLSLALWGNIGTPEKAGDISRFGGTGIENLLLILLSSAPSMRGGIRKFPSFSEKPAKRRTPSSDTEPYGSAWRIRSSLPLSFGLSSGGPCREIFGLCFP